MKKLVKSRTLFFVYLLLVVILAGCASRDATQKTVYAEQRGDAKPYVLRDKKAMSPLELHLQARKMVNPEDTSPTHRYTYLAEDYKKRISQSSGQRLNAAPNMIVPISKPGQAFSERLQSAPLSTHTKSARFVPTPNNKPDERRSQRSVAKLNSQTKQSQDRFSDASFGASVTGFRVGKHPDKTRIVLDVSAPTSFDYKVDNEKNVLILTVEDASWSTESKRVFSSHDLLLAYLAKPGRKKGTNLAIRMKKPIKVLFKTTYPAGDAKSFRIVLDIAPA